MKRMLSFIFVFTFLLTSIFSEKEKNETIKDIHKVIRVMEL